MKDNKSFNELVKYIDNDLIDVLSEEQRDKIYTLAASAIALKERMDSSSERAEQKLSGARMEQYRIGDPPPSSDNKLWQWIKSYIT